MSEISASFTLTARDAGELGRMVQAIGRALEGISDSAFVADDAVTATLPPPEWYRLHGERFVADLQPAARNALRTIVDRGPVVPVAEVGDAVGRHGSRLAGTLASIGSAVRRMQAPAPPFSADHKRGQYVIDVDVQAALRPHLDRAVER